MKQDRGSVWASGGYLIAREAQDDESLAAVLIIERSQFLVLGCEAALARHIYNKHHLALVLG